MTRYAVRHATVYEYGSKVSHSHHLLHLTPREFAFQRCIGHSISLDPEPKNSTQDVDAFGNAIARLEYDRAHRSLAVIADMEVEVVARAPLSPDGAEPWEAVRGRLSYHAAQLCPEDLDACRFRMRSSHVLLKPAFEDYAAECFLHGRPIAAAADDLMRKIHREFKYAPGSTNNRTSVLENLSRRHGVCQDFAHFMIACLRSLGLAARYVSGYIRTVRKGGETAIGGDASHAWVSVYCPPLGWIDFDPTNDCLVSEDHITLAWGRDFGDVSPLRGVIVGGRRHKLKVDVRVQPL